MVELTLTLAGLGHLVARSAASLSSPTLWYITRMCAVGAYVLLTLTVALGMLQSLARRSGEHLTWIADELHQFLATLAGVLVAAHVVTLILDPFLPFTIVNILFPVAEPYRPFAVDLGVYSLYGMALLLFSSWLRRRIAYRLWRSIHYVSFLTVVLVTAHGLLAGSDAQELWMRALYAAAAGSLIFAFLMRLFFSRPPRAKAKAPAPTEEEVEAEAVPRLRGRTIDA